MIFESKSVSETYKIADKILNKIKPGSVIALLGDLGAGKTTFTQGFAKALKIEERVGSPTFKLVSEYASVLKLLSSSSLRSQIVWSTPNSLKFRARFFPQ